MPTCSMIMGPVEAVAPPGNLATMLQARPVLALQDLEAEDPGGPMAAVMDILSDGVILTDRSARVLYMNRSARELVSRRLLATRNGQLCTALAHDTRKLHALISTAVRGSGVSAHMRMGTRLFVTVTAPGGLSPGSEGPQSAVILLHDLEAAHVPSLDSIIAYFGLTPAEARLAQEIIKGDGLARCARRLGIRITTVRSHLRHIFEKTETKRQAHLVGLLLRCGSYIAASRTSWQPCADKPDRDRSHAGS